MTFNKYILGVIFLAMPCGDAVAEDVWLPQSKGFFQAEKVSPALYLDLGDDPEALGRLSDSVFVLDDPEVKKSDSLICPESLKKYLIRSFLLNTPGAKVYKAPNRLIVSVIAFGDYRQPDRGAIAICLPEAPESIQGNASFLR